MVISICGWMVLRRLKIGSTSQNDLMRIPGFSVSSSSRSGGVGIKYGFSDYFLTISVLTLLFNSLTGADTVVFYDSDFNPQMDKQCEDRYVFSLFFCFYEL